MDQLGNKVAELDRLHSKGWRLPCLLYQGAWLEVEGCPVTERGLGLHLTLLSVIFACRPVA